jgi:molecular chaperone DnaJ
MNTETFYSILGVDENATQDEIKKAYRTLAKENHPDKGGDEELFKKISVAYDTLGDDTKRKEYDLQRKNPFANMGGGFDINSIFEQMMGGTRRQQHRAPDKVLNIILTPVDSFFGVKKEIKYQYDEKCVPCDGKGGERVTCKTCNGSGVVIQILGTGMFRQQIQMTCQGCGGQGSILNTKCKTCYGVGLTKQEENLNVSIPKNVDNGDFMRLRGKGDYNISAKIRGDVILKVELNQEHNFEKMGLDLIYKKKISALELILNDSVEIEHPEGTLRIKIPENFDTEKPLRIPNKGYKTDIIGNFYIKISVSHNKNSAENDLNKIISKLNKTN